MGIGGGAIFMSVGINEEQRRRQRRSACLVVKPEREYKTERNRRVLKFRTALGGPFSRCRLLFFLSLSPSAARVAAAAGRIV